MISGQVAFEGILEVASLVASQDPVVFQADAARPDAERFQKTGEGIWGDQLAAFPIRPWVSLDLSQRLRQMRSSRTCEDRL
jgi:hypothetical protein